MSVSEKEENRSEGIFDSAARRVLQRAFEVSSLVEEKKNVPKPYRKKMVLKNWLQEISLEEFLFEFVTLGVEEPCDFSLVEPVELKDMGMSNEQIGTFILKAQHEKNSSGTTAATSFKENNSHANMQRPPQPHPKLEVEPKSGLTEPWAAPAARTAPPQRKQAPVSVAEPPLDAAMPTRKSLSGTAPPIHEENPTPSPGVLADLQSRFPISKNVIKETPAKTNNQVGRSIEFPVKKPSKKQPVKVSTGAPTPPEPIVASLQKRFPELPRAAILLALQSNKNHFMKAVQQLNESKTKTATKPTPHSAGAMSLQDALLKPLRSKFPGLPDYKLREALETTKNRFSSAVKLLESIHPEMKKKPKVVASPAPAPAPAPQPTKEEIFAGMGKKGSSFDRNFGQLARQIPGMSQSRKAYFPATGDHGDNTARASDSRTLFLWLEDCHVGLGKSLEQFTELGVETVDDFALVERNDLTKMGLHPSKIVAFFRKVKGIKPKARVDAANLALRVKTERKEYCDTSINLDSDDEKLLDTIAPGTPDMSTMKGYSADEQQVMHALKTPIPDSSTTRNDHHRKDESSRHTQVYQSRQVVDASPAEESKEELQDAVPKFIRDYSTQEAQKNFNLNDFYNLLEDISPSEIKPGSFFSLVCPDLESKWQVIVARELMKFLDTVWECYEEGHEECPPEQVPALCDQTLKTLQSLIKNKSFWGEELTADIIKKSMQKTIYHKKTPTTAQDVADHMIVSIGGGKAKELGEPITKQQYLDYILSSIDV